MVKDEIESFVIDGRLKDNADLVNRAIKNREGQAILITIQTVSRKRTSQQNRYIHRLFTIFTQSLNELGNTFSMSDTKALCAAKFLIIDVVNQDSGDVIGQRIRGTSELDTKEFGEYFEKVIAWAADTFGIILPYPNTEELFVEHTRL